MAGAVVLAFCILPSLKSPLNTSGIQEFLYIIILTSDYILIIIIRYYLMLCSELFIRLHSLFCNPYTKVEISVISAEKLKKSK